MDSIFHAYDIRGKYPKEINEAVVEKIVADLAKKFFKSGKIVIGHGARLSSPNLYKAILNSLKASTKGGSASGGKNLKLKAIPVGMITTPMLSFLVNKLKADGGIMITASHNPKNYNGLKVVGKKAVPISGYELRKFIH
ncbi:MAG: hypothetical protein V3T98_01875 [Candidatus Paceibacterota bacterium]